MGPVVAAGPALRPQGGLSLGSDAALTAALWQVTCMAARKALDAQRKLDKAGPPLHMVGTPLSRSVCAQ